METATQQPMSIEAFHALSEYLALTEGQKKWVDIFIETPDANLATRKAYGATDAAYVAMLTRKIETSPRIIAALDRYLGRTPRERFLRDLELDIKHAKGMGRAELRRLQAQILGFDATDAELGAPTGERFKVGDLCVQNGRTYRITAIDPETGRPLTADEIEE